MDLIVWIDFIDSLSRQGGKQGGRQASKEASKQSINQSITNIKKKKGVYYSVFFHSILFYSFSLSSLPFSLLCVSVLALPIRPFPGSKVEFPLKRKMKQTSYSTESNRIGLKKTLKGSKNGYLRMNVQL